MAMQISAALTEPRELPCPLRATLRTADPTMRDARSLAILARREVGVRARAERRVTTARAAHRLDLHRVGESVNRSASGSTVAFIEIISLDSGEVKPRLNQKT